MPDDQLPLIQPVERAKPLDFYSMHARKLLGMPETWRWFRLESIPACGHTHTLITGSIPDGVVYKSGPRKGHLKWKHRHDERQVLISHDDHDAFIESWEREHDTCSDCLRMKASCSRCDGSGRPARAVTYGRAL